VDGAAIVLGLGGLGLVGLSLYRSGRSLLRSFGDLTAPPAGGGPRR
jgi:hypothetical protein